MNNGTTALIELDARPLRKMTATCDPRHSGQTFFVLESLGFGGIAN